MRVFSHNNVADKAELAFINDDMPVQFLPEFSKFYDDYYGEEIKIFYSEKLNAYMPLRYHYFSSFRFGQIIHAPVKDCQELLPELQKQFFDELIGFVKSKNIFDRFTQPHPYGFIKALPDNVKSCEFGSYIIDLVGQTEEEIFEKFKRPYRQGIQATIKSNPEIKYGRETIHDFYRIYESTMLRVCMSNEPVSYFEKLFEILGDNHVLTGVIYDNGKAIGCTLVLYSKYSAIVTHAGSDMGESKLYGASKLLHFEMMKKMKALGVKKYDFVGVRLNNKNPKLEGVFKFKEGFGGELVKGFLWKKDIHPFKTKVYDLLLKVKNFNKPSVTDIIDQQE